LQYSFYMNSAFGSFREPTFIHDWESHGTA
jgi:hypothetical protein